MNFLKNIIFIKKLLLLKKKNLVKLKEKYIFIKSKLFIIRFN